MALSDEVVPLQPGPVEAAGGAPFVRIRHDLTRTVLSVLVIGVLLLGSFWILRPFLLPGLWAMTLVVATWPLMLKVQARVRRQSVAVLVMTLAMVIVFVAPIGLALQTLAENTDTLTRWLRTFAETPFPPPPDWVAGLPLVGEKVASTWLEISLAGKEGLAARIALAICDVITQDKGQVQLVARIFSEWEGTASTIDGLEEDFADPPDDDYITVRL